MFLFTFDNVLHQRIFNAVLRIIIFTELDPKKIGTVRSVTSLSLTEAISTRCHSVCRICNEMFCG